MRCKLHTVFAVLAVIMVTVPPVAAETEWLEELVDPGFPAPDRTIILNGEVVWIGDDPRPDPIVMTEVKNLENDEGGDTPVWIIVPHK